MVAPLVNRSESQTSKRSCVFKDWQAQTKPYNLRLPCRLWYAYALNDKADSRSWSINEKSSSAWVDSQNQARERFKSELGDTASWGAAIAAEWRGSTEMIGKRALQLYRFTSALRKGRFRAAATALGVVDRVSMKKKRKHMKSKDYGALWLEYSYGWAPLVSDIYTGVQVLDAPLPGRTVKGRARRKIRIQYRNPPSGVWYGLQTYDLDSKCQIIADVSVTNPNLYLSNQLGLVNPAMWVLEGIPFSFVVDWFSNLSSYVAQLTDFVGCDISNPATTHLVKGEDHMEAFGPNYYDERGHKQFVCLTRETSGIPSVVLQFGYEVPNWKRGLNAVSLLTQALRSF